MGILNGTKNFSEMEKRNEVLELSFEFALQVIEFSELLEEKKKIRDSRAIVEIRHKLWHQYTGSPKLRKQGRLHPQAQNFS